MVNFHVRNRLVYLHFAETSSFRGKRAQSRRSRFILIHTLDVLIRSRYYNINSRVYVGTPCLHPTRFIAITYVHKHDTYAGYTPHRWHVKGSMEGSRKLRSSFSEFALDRDRVLNKSYNTHVKSTQTPVLKCGLVLHGFMVRLTLQGYDRPGAYDRLRLCEHIIDIRGEPLVISESC